MTIVHVSIVAGCSFASNNPNTAATLAGLSIKAEEGATDPRSHSPWAKGCTIQELFLEAHLSLRRSAHLDVAARRAEDALGPRHSLGQLHKASQAPTRRPDRALLRHNLPCLSARLPHLCCRISVPESGLGCRSLSVLVYFCCQVGLVIVQLLLTVRS